MNGNMKSQETLLSLSLLTLKIKNQIKPSVNALRSSFMPIAILFSILLLPGISVRILKHGIQIKGSVYLHTTGAYAAKRCKKNPKKTNQQNPPAH